MGHPMGGGAASRVLVWRRFDFQTQGGAFIPARWRAEQVLRWRGESRGPSIFLQLCVIGDTLGAHSRGGRVGGEKYVDDYEIRTAVAAMRGQGTFVGFFAWILVSPEHRDGVSLQPRNCSPMYPTNFSGD